jgi:hypothetical protein
LLACSLKCEIINLMKKVTRYVFTFSLVAAMSVLTVLALRDKATLFAGGDAVTYTTKIDVYNCKDLPEDGTTGTSESTSNLWLQLYGVGSTRRYNVTGKGSGLQTFYITDWVEERGRFRNFDAGGYFYNTSPLHSLVSLTIRYAVLESPTFIDQPHASDGSVIWPAPCRIYFSSYLNSSGDLSGPQEVTSFYEDNFQDGSTAGMSPYYYNLTYSVPSGSYMNYAKVVASSACVVSYIIYTYTCISNEASAVSSEGATADTGSVASGQPLTFSLPTT